jgi:hypothetical protein
MPTPVGDRGIDKNAKQNDEESISGETYSFCYGSYNQSGSDNREHELEKGEEGEGNGRG